MSNYSYPPPPCSSAKAAATSSVVDTAIVSSTYCPDKVQIRSYQGKFNQIYRPYKAKFDKNREERKSQVPQVQESKHKEKLSEKMLEIEEYEGDLIDLVDLDFKDVEEDFITHSIAEFMIDFTKSLKK
ncbi:Hypothetical predicted protein [Olea europaea subsp. europaea]|uniref:Uncharacterized protein n=1 Tax=Olea europaea subsp. europaea TaxID=158383 RepID=A0A8S0U9Q9_OLEEU|nr:Hypothetical predicted protein [Olea europaea subsp. europaea]